MAIYLVLKNINIYYFEIIVFRKSIRVSLHYFRFFTLFKIPSYFHDENTKENTELFHVYFRFCWYLWLKKNQYLLFQRKHFWSFQGFTICIFFSLGSSLVLKISRYRVLWNILRAVFVLVLVQGNPYIFLTCCHYSEYIISHFKQCGVVPSTPIVNCQRP